MFFSSQTLLLILGPIILAQYLYALFALTLLAKSRLKISQYVIWNLFILLVFFAGSTVFIIYYYKKRKTEAENIIAAEDRLIREKAEEKKLEEAGADKISEKSQEDANSGEENAPEDKNGKGDGENND